MGVRGVWGVGRVDVSVVDVSSAKYPHLSQQLMQYVCPHFSDIVVVVFGSG